MSSVVTVRVPRELKEKMKKLKVNWSKEIRKYIEERVRDYELLEIIDKARKEARKRKIKTDSARIIREDRESR
ncbi:MAG: VapB-type antitoxin [Candidatus Korarchaeota archaeon]|nr:VapB-type antitoxin [Candidatus Korarchaeota archaeon]